MTALDWLIVLLLNGSIIAYGIYLSRGVKSSTDWFLAGRSLPWWLVGVSMYATAIDSSDLVADSGGTYTLGLSYFVTNWIGVVGGWALGAFVIFPTMYRIGVYTNAEYLEVRFGPAARVLCVFIQVQYRTLVLAIIATTLYLTLSIVCGLESWWPVIAIAALATVYTALGGLKSVAVTDALQFLVMTIAGLIIWFFVWNAVGGWSGMSTKLNAHENGLAEQLLHVGHDNVDRVDVSAETPEQIARRLIVGGRYDVEAGAIERRTPAWLTCLAFVIVGVAYSVVNHTQAMRMLASKSEWDLKMSVAIAGVAMLVMTFFNLTMGVMGRALHPVVESLPKGQVDSIYPYLANEFATVGLRGIVVAGVLAASFSTFDSIGSTLSALLTRDVYARLIVRNGDDRHYMRVGQWLTPLVIGGSFAYVPFLKSGMLVFYLELTSAFVVPLLTLFFMGVLTRVHRRAGLIGLLCGASYGVLRLFAEPVAESLGVAIMPSIMVNSFAAYPFSVAITAGAMLFVSVIVGFEQSGVEQYVETSPWLRKSQLEVQELAAQESRASDRSTVLAAALAALVVAAGVVLSFIVFW
ncbi:MAG: sodium/solute symporter [Pirellulaceae bacterium]|jgi:SSS family solute:Na+ symporter|nr:sodium/solute symporter [Pirellulaceae bacterium]